MAWKTYFWEAQRQKRTLEELGMKKASGLSGEHWDMEFAGLFEQLRDGQVEVSEFSVMFNAFSVPVSVVSLLEQLKCLKNRLNEKQENVDQVQLFGDSNASPELSEDRRHVTLVQPITDLQLIRCREAKTFEETVQTLLSDHMRLLSIEEVIASLIVSPQKFLSSRAAFVNLVNDKGQFVVIALRGKLLKLELRSWEDIDCSTIFYVTDA